MKDSRVKILYRIAEKVNKDKFKQIAKVKPDWINNQSCLFNISKYKEGSELIVFGDRLEDSEQMVVTIADKYVSTVEHGNTPTFLEVLHYAIDNFDSDTIVYFVEDDYLHRPKFSRIIEEGLDRADYVSLYDHPDKYGNPEILFHTKSSHWKFTHSTTMTFATRVKTLVFDAKVFEELCKDQPLPPDHDIFSFLTSKMHRRLATPIPGFATHGETKWLSPVINWIAHTK